tara:strand:- start:214 stop:408 length:195 start_codon:yes stop_codon:yes gene_type:complete
MRILIVVLAFAAQGSAQADIPFLAHFDGKQERGYGQRSASQYPGRSFLQFAIKPEFDIAPLPCS